MAHVCNHECAVLDTEICMWEVGQHGNHLILVSEGRDERANRPATSKIMQEFELVLDSQRATCDVDFL